MKIIRVGLTSSDQISLKHDKACISSNAPLEIYAAKLDSGKSMYLPDGPVKARLYPGQRLNFAAGVNNSNFNENGLEDLSSLLLRTTTGNGQLFVKCRKNETVGRCFQGELIVLKSHDSMQLILQLTLEEYLRGVLQSEIPASYHIEAIKAQAIVARTYALNPRINHSLAHCNVCDSFLCCQYFAGFPSHHSESHDTAIRETVGQILAYKDKPILALFSACAGGHTESYENCFSNPETNEFPPEPIPYLRGVPEGQLPPSFKSNPSEAALRQLWQEPTVQTCDAWSSSFKWSIEISAQSLEAQMHRIVEEMLNEKDTAPFVIPSPDNIFGEIQSFQIDKRGVAGTAIVLSVCTSKGKWQFKKELVIRNLFKNHELAIHRLNSARIFVDHRHNQHGLLTGVFIGGFGRGHGVGFQQIGAQGLASKKINHQSILQHYFSGCYIVSI
jgi:stage II sporulation protein D